MSCRSSLSFIGPSPIRRWDHGTPPGRGRNPGRAGAAQVCDAGKLPTTSPVDAATLRLCCRRPAGREGLPTLGRPDCALAGLRRLPPDLLCSPERRLPWPARPPGPPRWPRRRGHAPAAAVVITPDAIHAAHTALAVPPSTAYCEQHFKIACYLPGQIQQAYGLPQLYRRGITGQGQTIVIVDSFGSPTVAPRPGRVRPGRRAPRAAVAAGHPARREGAAVQADRRPGRAGPARPTWTSSTPTPSRPARASCWSRRRPRRTRARPASRRSSRPRST